MWWTPKSSLSVAQLSAAETQHSVRNQTYRHWVQFFYSVVHNTDSLVLCQGYVPEKCHINWTQNSHLKQCIFWGLGDWQPHSI
jgi:hypothetical protein